MKKNAVEAKLHTPETLERGLVEKLNGRWVVNVSKAPVLIKPDLEFTTYLAKHGRKPVEEKTIVPGESLWLDNYFIIPFREDGGRCYFAECYNNQMLQQTRRNWMSGKLKPL